MRTDAPNYHATFELQIRYDCSAADGSRPLSGTSIPWRCEVFPVSTIRGLSGSACKVRTEIFEMCETLALEGCNRCLFFHSSVPPKFSACSSRCHVLSLNGYRDCFVFCGSCSLP